MTTVDYWEIELEGSEIDLKLIEECNCESANIYVKNGHYTLKFSALPNEQQDAAYTRGQELVGSLNALCRLRFPGFSNLSTQRMLRVQRADGSQGTTIMAKTAVAKARTFPATITNGGKTTRPLDVVSNRLVLAAQDPVVARILRLRNTDNFDWIHMYRVLEAIEADQDIVEAGWITTEQQRLFKHTANSVSASGDKARHGRERNKPPLNPMTEENARTLLDSIIESWLNEKYTSQGS